MFSPRAACRFQRAVRLPPPSLTKRAAARVRFASTEATPGTAGGASGAVSGGLVGAGVALAVTFGWYYFSGANSAVQTAKQAKGYFDSATKSLKVEFDENTPDTTQALETLKDTANKYAGFVPGGKGYVESAFNDLETIRSKHGQEVDEVVRETYGQLRDVSKKGLSLDAASETYNILARQFERLLALADDAAQDIVSNHPELKEKLGGSVDQLKQLGQRLGPEAKKQIDETWEEVRNIVQQGISPDTIDRARRLLQDKVETLKKLAGEQGGE